MFIYVCSMVRPKDENKEAAIREKALEMIVEEGFDGLSMGRLAKAANVSPATIYLYFENREDLLNQIFIDINQKFTENTLEGFDTEMPFEAGMWVQWKNRMKYTLKYPLHFRFIEQFMHSPQVHALKQKDGAFKKAMGAFFHNCKKRGDIPDMEVELFWAIAYGPLYGLMRFHLNGRSMMGNEFKLDEVKLRQTFEMAMKGFK